MDSCYTAMSDDLNSPVAIAVLFEAVRMINLLREGKEQITSGDLTTFSSFMYTFTSDVLGIAPEQQKGKEENTKMLIDAMLRIREEARKRKDFYTSDRIRDELTKLGIEIMDTKDGIEWKLN